MPEYESLRNSRDFRRVLDRGERARAGAVVVVRSPGRQGPPRVGLIVSRGSGNAVARNRIKRRIRPLIGRMNLQPGMDYVIIANSGVFDTPHLRLTEWLESATGGGS